MRKQYHLRPTTQGFDAWDVHRLIALSRELPVRDVPLTELDDLDANYWYQAAGDVPSCRSLVRHMRRVMEVDTDYPVILSREGRVMDGMHRICRCLLEEKKTVRAVRFTTNPAPDFRQVTDIDGLPY